MCDITHGVLPVKEAHLRLGVQGLYWGLFMPLVSRFFEGQADAVCVCVCVYSLSCVQFFATPWTVAHLAPLTMGFSRQEHWSGGKESACQCRRHGFDPWVGKIPWRRKWQPTPVFLPGKSHGQRSLVGYRSWGCKELDTTERLSTQACRLMLLGRKPLP